MKVLILEDSDSEYLLTEQLTSRFFKENGYPYEIVRAKDASSFLNLYDDSFSLLLLDILMEGELNGIDVSHKVREKNTDVPIVFITNTPNFAIESYEVEALHYILKPLTYEAFFIKMKKVLKHIELNLNKKILIKCRGESIAVSETDIIFIEVYGHTLTVHMKKETVSFRESLGELEKQLSSTMVRCSNSALVNLRYVEKVHGNDLYIPGTILPITRKYHASFLKSYYSYLGTIV